MALAPSIAGDWRLPVPVMAEATQIPHLNSRLYSNLLPHNHAPCMLRPDGSHPGGMRQEDFRRYPNTLRGTAHACAAPTFLLIPVGNMSLHHGSAERKRTPITFRRVPSICLPGSICVGNGGKYDCVTHESQRRVVFHNSPLSLGCASCDCPMQRLPLECSLTKLHFHENCTSPQLG